VTIPLFDVQAGFGGLKAGSRDVYSAAALLADMDRLQIGRALVRIVPEETDRDVPLSNRMLYDACEGAAGRLVPCPVMVPSAGGDFPPEQAQVDEAVGCGGGAVILRPAQDSWSLEEWSGGKLLSAMEARSVPTILLQKQVPLADVGRVAKAHARLPIILADTDYVSHRMVCGLLETFPNVYLSIGSNYTVHCGIEHLVGLVGAGRLLFGTGLPRVEPMMAVTQLMYADISEGDRKQIAWDNLERLIGGVAGASSVARASSVTRASCPCVPRASCPRVSSASSSSSSSAAAAFVRSEEEKETTEGKMPSGRKGETPSPRQMPSPHLIDRGRAGESLADLDIVDMHGHLGAYSFAIPHREPQALVAAMDRVGIRQILCSHMACMTGRVEIGNREVLAAMRACPGRILGYVTLWPANAESVEEETRRCLGQGFTGIKLHNSNGFPYTDPAYAPALAIANERRLPVLLHTWGRAEEFAQVRLFSEKYPRVNFLLAHSGIVALSEYIKIARELPNVFLDICSSAFPYGALDRMIAGAGAERIVWGSDGNFLNIHHQVGKVLGARCDDAVKRQILSLNARRILGAIEKA
jgi:predicted TIM-barrel fold metal-dependent hydrolase